METIWHYLINQFLNATATSFKKALKLSNYHDAMLKKAMDSNPDPDWALLYNRYHPLHLLFVAAYNDWKLAGGTQGGQSLNITQLLTLLITKINKWDIQVQNVFEKNTTGYKTLFPNGHYPFNSGAIDTRVMAVNTLGAALTLPAFAALKLEVDDFYSLLDGARDSHESAKGGTQEMSETLENKRKVIMTEQYRDLGFMINKGAENPNMIGPFFELNVLRNHLQVRFTGTLEDHENEAVLIHTFVADDIIRFKLTGTGSASFYLASSPNGTNSTPITLNGGDNQKFEVLSFNPANYGTHRYLTAINNGTTELDYEIELL